MQPTVYQRQQTNFVLRIAPPLGLCQMALPLKEIKWEKNNLLQCVGRVGEMKRGQ
jgi:hypothetical protein